MIRRLIALLVCTIASVMLLAPSASAVSCYGDYCSGQDPMASGCGADAVTVASLAMEGSHLELRWSPTCQTNWARYTEYSQGWCIGCNNWIEMRAVQDTGYMQRVNISNADPRGSMTLWTPMIYSPTRAVHAELVPSCTAGRMVQCAIDSAMGVERTDAV